MKIKMIEMEQGVLKRYKNGKEKFRMNKSNIKTEGDKYTYIAKQVNCYEIKNFFGMIFVYKLTNKYETKFLELRYKFMKIDKIINAKDLVEE